MRGKGKNLLIACVMVAIALCVWGTVGWRRAYRAEGEVGSLKRAQELLDRELLKLVVRGGAANAEMALDGVPDHGADPGW